MAFPAPKNTYPSRDEVASYLQSYAARFDLPVRVNSRVTSLTKDADRYIVATASDSFQAEQVVVATGPFQVPVIPPISTQFDEKVLQLHSADYRTPSAIPKGQVLVVGGGNSGYQIAQELAATREVYLAVGQRMPALPQRLLRRDIFWWLSGAGYMKVNVATRLGQRLSQRDALIGSSPKKAERAGVRMKGRLTGARGRQALFDDGDQIDDVDSVVWATGYRLDHSWIDLPEVKDDFGRITHQRGVTPSYGLYLVGQTWQHTRGSALIGWVGNDAAFLAELISSRRREPNESAVVLSEPTDSTLGSR